MAVSGKQQSFDEEAMGGGLKRQCSSQSDGERVYWLPRIALAAFVIGAVAILIGFIQGGRFIGIKLGVASWLAAYFLILFDNFKRKLDVRTRGGIVRYKDGPWGYALPYVPLVVMGLGALLMLVISTVFP